MTSNLPTINQKITTANSQLTLQLLLKNSSNEALFFRPTIEDWVIDNTEIISSTSNIHPFYTSLAPQREINQTITLQIPPNLSPGQTLKNWLRFPGIQEEAIPINLEIIPSSNVQKDPQNLTISFSLKLPYFSESSRHLNGDSTLDLISGMIDLEKITSRWLVAELCVKLWQIGEKYRESERGSQLLKELQPSIFYQNGVTAFSSAKVPEWIAKTIANINTTLSCAPGEGHLLYIWESWLFSLVETDLQDNKTNNHYSVPKFLAKDIVTQIGMSSERWFSGIILGLASLSVPIETNLQKIATSKNNQATYNDKTHQSTINLMTGLPGFDSIPVRWLAVEILLIIAQIGDKYAQTEDGMNLLSCLNRTRFFKNGMLAFASAKVPRWLNLSQSAINAYYSNIGFPSGNNGLLNLWEMWLWSLVPHQLEISSINDKFAILDTTTEIFVKDLGMDQQRWFTAIILGLGKLSPRIAQQLTEISNQVSDLPSETFVLNSNYGDVIAEEGSIQR